MENGVQVINKPDESRFVIEAEGHVAFLEYVERTSMIVFPHTVVPTELEGIGYGKMLAEAALGWAKEKGKKIVPTCPFVASYIRRHPEYKPMVAPGFIL
ncbi:MAG: N-acetyltransferase [Bacteroidia bacterium]|nr:N-acetyltransferase [Bacteroidia bacterium]